MTLVEFLTARYNETETIAEDAIRNGEGTLDWADDGDPTDIHIARHDPAAVLADVASKRAILAAANAWTHQVVEDCWYTCSSATVEREGEECCNDNTRGTGCDCGRDNQVAQVLRLLARPYRDHPDFDPTWETT